MSDEDTPKYPFNSSNSPFVEHKPKVLKRWIPPQALESRPYKQIGTSIPKSSGGTYGLTAHTPQNLTALSLVGAWTTTDKKYLWVPHDCALQMRSVGGGVIEFRVIDKDGNVRASGAVGGDTYKKLAEGIR